MKEAIRRPFRVSRLPLTICLIYLFLGRSAVLDPTPAFADFVAQDDRQMCSMAPESTICTVDHVFFSLIGVFSVF